MRVVYDYGLPFGGRNRHGNPDLNLPGATANRQGHPSTTVIIISRRAAAGGEASPLGAERTATPSSVPTAAATPDGRLASNPASAELTEESKNLLRNHSRAIRLHEQAHLAALGGYASGPALYQSEKAPDGTSYLTGGRVKVDLSPVPGDPQATVRKARAIQRAALAPGDSSPTDLATASKAYQLQKQAMDEIRNAHLTGTEEGGDV